MSGYIGPAPVPQATQTREAFTATSGQTTFNTGGYTAGFIDVYLNGVKLAAADYTATNGSDVVLAVGAAADDILETVAYSAFTVADQTFTGDIVMSDGLTINNDAATVLTVDRATSDGTLVDFKKDGTSVGGVGVDYGTEFYVGGGGSGFYLNTITIRPTTGGAASTLTDGTIDFGYPTARWKDLYLSGGVYLGGTGAANLLDDYEEGTWSPAISGVTVTSGTFEGYYTKVGNMVTVWVRMSNATLSGSGSVITGLPFTVNVRSSSSTPALYYHADGDKPVYGLAVNNTTQINMQYNRASSTWVAAHFTAGSQRYCHMSLTYKVA